MAATPGSYGFIDHTGDLGIEVTAPAVEAVFEAAAAALFDLLAGGSEIRAMASRDLLLSAGDTDELLVRWLAELLYLHDAEGWLFCRFRVVELSTNRLRASVQGELYDPKRHTLRTQIKAVTYHQAGVVRENGLWRARVIFDV